MAEVLEGYRRLRPVPRHLDWHVAQVQLMRVADPFRAGAATWRDRVEANVRAVEAAISRLGRGR
jgi:hypothetical protein